MSEGGGSEDSSDEAEAEELSLADAEAPARALLALNALRKSRQHYDVVLVAGGAELPAHRAVLAAASPALLQALPPSGPAAPHRLDGLDAPALAALVEYAYSGRLRVPSAQAARALYLAACRLRMERARLHLAERLLRRLSPAACLPLRALPALPPDQLHLLDRYIADHVSVCACALSAPHRTALHAPPSLRSSRRCGRAARWRRCRSCAWRCCAGRRRGARGARRSRSPSPTPCSPGCRPSRTTTGT